MDSLSQEELTRYSRQISLPQLGLEGQLKLKSSSVLVIGAGGLGVPVLQYLTAAGIGKIGIVDPDRVEISNLHRQILYSSHDVGQFKAKVAAQKLQNQNPNVELLAFPIALNRENALELVGQFDLIVDGSDNFPTRYLVNDACVLSNKPLVYASIYRFEGQVSVFNFTDETGIKGPNYRDIFPVPPDPGMVPDCAEGGVLGVLPGLIGCIQANEALKILSGLGGNLSGRLFVLDALKFESRTFEIMKDPQNPLSEENPSQHDLIDYDIFCKITSYKSHQPLDFKSIDPLTLMQWIKLRKDFQWIDVREPNETPVSGFQTQNMPLSNWNSFIDEISREKPVVVMCQSGKRSSQAIKRYLDADCKADFYNLEDGIQGLNEALKKTD